MLTVRSYGMGVLLAGGITAEPIQAQVTIRAQSSLTAPLVIRDVTVIDVQTGTPIRNRTVVIAGRRIHAITADTARLPAGARVINGRGKYLIPGLWDLHVHPARFVDIAYPLFIANGVTGVRDASSEVPLVTLNKWKQEIVAGTRPGPRVLVSGQALDGPDTNPAKVSYHRALATPSEARLAVDLLTAAGADMIKTYNLSREMALAIAAEAKRIGIPFGGHSPAVSGLELSDSGAAILDHEPWLPPEVCADSTGMAAVSDGCRAAAEHFRRNNTWITVGHGMFGEPNGPQPELDSLITVDQQRHTARFLPIFTPWPRGWPARSVILDSLRRRPMPLWSPGMDAALRRRAPRPNSLYRAGMPIVVGTDAALPDMASFFIALTPGFMVPTTLAALVQGGLTPAEALQAATLNPARALRATDSLGTVEAGKVADLVLLDANPLEAIWNTTKIRAVIANGRYYDRAALDGLLVQAERAAVAMRPAAATTVP